MGWQHSRATLTGSPDGRLIETGDLAEAERHAEWAVQGFRTLGRQRAEAASTNRLARILRRRGELDAALTRHEQAQMLYAEVGDVIGELGVRAAMTAAYRENGDLTRARLNAAALLDEIRPLAGRTHAFMRSDARLAAARGEHEKARRILNELRVRAGEAWREDDEETLASLETR